MPADNKRHKRRLNKSYRKNNFRKTNFISKTRLFYLVLLLLFIFAIFFKLGLANKYWNDDNRLVLAAYKEGGEVVVSSIDPVVGEIISISIPQNTEVEVADNLGKLKIGKVWDLSIHENKKGRLLPLTITTYFGFPVSAWGNSSTLGLIDGGLGKFVKGLIARDTNLRFSDKLAIGLFARSLDNVKKVNIDLSNTQMLRKVVLEDGSEGFQKTDIESVKIKSFFTDYYFSAKPTRVWVINKGSDFDNKSLVKVFEVLGGKVVSITNEDEMSEFNCKVGPKGDKRAEAISAIYGCELTKISDSEKFDIEMILGNKFTQ